MAAFTLPTTSTDAAAPATHRGDGRPLTLARAMTRWVSLATSAMFIGPGALLWLHTGDIWNGIGLGAFCAAWGGPGFGVMFGLTAWSARQEH